MHDCACGAECDCDGGSTRCEHLCMDYSDLTFAKDSREDGKRKRDDAKAKIRAYESEQKTLARKRDGAHYCRLVPNCDQSPVFETAHLDDKGMGGDHGRRSSAELLIRACFAHHRGNWSLHSRDLRVEFLTDDKANGPIQVWGRDRLGHWFLVGRESAVGVWERD